MAIAYYMKFLEGHHGSRDRVGGQPTHLPKTKLWKEEDASSFGFLMELWVDKEKLIVPNTLYIQVYQTIEEGDEPLPEVIQIPFDAELNKNRNIVIHPDAKPWDIEFDRREDPDGVPQITMEHSSLFRSKLAGFDPWGSENCDMKFLGQISEMPLHLNFGGMLCSLYLNLSGKVIAKLH